jgi:signal peptidase I
LDLLDGEPRTTAPPTGPTEPPTGSEPPFAPQPPLDRSARRAIFERAETLANDLPRALRKRRGHLDEAALWALGDATRAIRAALAHRPTTDADVRALGAAADTLDVLIETHVPAARPRGASDIVASLTIAVVIALFIRTFLFEAFQIPTGSMIPTLLVGDRIFVSKFVYGIPVPFTHERLFAWRAPARGEVVVFEFPRGGAHAGKHFIKRIIAVGGDRVRLESNTVMINDEVFGEPRVVSATAACLGEPGETCGSRGLGDVSAAMARGEVATGCPCITVEEHAGDSTWTTQHVRDQAVCDCQRTYVEPSGGMSCSKDTRRIVEAPRTLRNEPDWPRGRPSPYVLSGWGPHGQDAVEQSPDGRTNLVVPDGFVFVMGDNRDFSEDGRYWGLVPINRIEGKAWLIWYSSEDPWGRFLKSIH